MPDRTRNELFPRWRGRKNRLRPITLTDKWNYFHGTNVGTERGRNGGRWEQARPETSISSRANPRRTKAGSVKNCGPKGKGEARTECAAHNGRESREFSARRLTHRISRLKTKWSAYSFSGSAGRKLAALCGPAWRFDSEFIDSPEAFRGRSLAKPGLNPEIGLAGPRGSALRGNLSAYPGDKNETGVGRRVSLRFQEAEKDLLPIRPGSENFLRAEKSSARLTDISSLVIAGVKFPGDSCHVGYNTVIPGGPRQRNGGGLSDGVATFAKALRAREVNEGPETRYTAMRADKERRLFPEVTHIPSAFDLASTVIGSTAF
ncbi:hypothetical protein KM043_006351 [Ampulex compressa]|nr:hypothetical protein KM043_006351 [Ampulex compressa]